MFLDHKEETCLAFRELLDRVGDKWSLLTMDALDDAPMHFNELKRSLDSLQGIGKQKGSISQRILTLTLRGLQRDGMVTRTVLTTNPPRVNYALTKLGRTLVEPTMAMVGWARANRPAVTKARVVFDRSLAAKPSRRR